MATHEPGLLGDFDSLGSLFGGVFGCVLTS